MKTNKTLISCAVAGALSASAAGALASGFQLMEQNASGLGNAYSGQAAAAENASTIFFNPAGMTRLPGRQVVGALNFIKPSAKFTNNGTSAAPSPLLPLGNSGGDAGGWAIVPNGYISWQINARTWLGVGLSVPFGLATEYDQGWIGRFQAQKTDLKTIDVNPSIAYKVNDQFSIGGGISYQRAKLKLDRSASFVATEGPQNIKLDDSEWGWNIGAMFMPSPSTRIGVSYRSTMDYNLNGTVLVRSAAGATVINTTANAPVEFPDTLSVGISHVFSPKVELLGDVTYTRWGKIKRVTLTSPTLGPLDAFDFQFKDTFRVGVGMNYRMSDRFTLKTGVAYDKTPVEDPFRTVSLPDNDRFWLAIGGKYAMSKQATIDFGYAHLFIDDSTINQLQGISVAAPPPFAKGNVRGSYSNNVNILSVQFSYTF